MPSPGITGSTSRDWCWRDDNIQTFAVPLAGIGLVVDQIGCVPLGAAIVSRIRTPARYAWP